MVRGRTLLGLMLAAMVPWLVGAQEDDPILQQAAQGAIELGDTVVQLPAVYVTRVDISIANENLPGLEEIEVEEEVLVPEPTDEQAVPATNNVVSGAFTATNESDAVQSGLQYELVVVAAEQGYEVETISPDDPRVYYRVPPTGDISLGPGGSQIIAFEHEVPALPGDNYRVRIQLLTDDGRQLGWQDSVVVLGGSPDAFVTLTATNSSLTSVDPGQALTLTATADAQGVAADEPLTPVATVSRLLDASGRFENVTLEPLTLTGTDEQAVEFALLAGAEPGAYVVSMSLRDASGAVRSSIAEYTYVVRGVTASILEQSIQSLEGTTAVASFTIAGPADLETVLDGAVAVEILVNGEVMGVTESPVIIPAGQTRTGSTTIALSREVCSAPDIRVTVKDAAGMVLAERQAPGGVAAACGPGELPTGFDWLRAGPLGWLGGIIIVVIAIAALLLMRRRRGRRRPPASGGTMAAGLLLLVGALLTLAYHTPVLANGIQWQTGNTGFALSLFVNQPRHETTVPAGLGLDYEARLTYAASDTAAVGAQLGVYLLTEGGHVQDPNNRSWIRIGQGNANVGEAQNPRTFSLTSRLPLPVGYSHTTTTIWTAAIVGEGAGIANARSIYDLSWITLDYGPGGPPDSGTPGVQCISPQVSVSDTATCQESQVSLRLNNTCEQSEERPPLDVVLVLDRSGSMRDRNKITDAKSAAFILINQLDPSKDQVAVVSYETFASVDLSLTSDMALARSVVARLNAFGDTNVADGVASGQGRLQSARVGATPIMIVLTDGIANRRLDGSRCESYPHTPTGCTQGAIDQATAAKQSGTSVYTVGFDLQDVSVPKSMLQQMADSPDHFFDAPSAGELQQAFSQIAQDITNQAAANTTVTHVLPIGLTYVPGSAAPAPSSVSGSTLTWDLGIISVGEEPTISFTVAFDSGSAQQSVNITPDSQVTYIDNRSQPQTLFTPATRHTPVSCNPDASPSPTSGFDPGGVREVD